MKPKSLHLIVGVVITLSFAPTSRAETGSTIAAQTHVDRALSYYNRGNLTGAISELRKARDALFELRRFDEAVIEWRAAKVLDPKEPFARTALAVGLYAVGRVNDAKVQYAEAVMLDSRYGNPDSLSVDIRWKSDALNVLRELHKSIH